VVRATYLLDTNVISEPLRPKPNPHLLQRLQEHKDEIAIASVVWHELWFGCYRLPPSARRTAVEAYLNDVVALIPILPYNEGAARWHAAERARLTSLGKTPPFADGQIAAVARVYDLRLVTINLADYTHFEEVQLVSWH
jgi:tRNA(fMet)-specific endonuclease VapC